MKRSLLAAAALAMACNSAAKAEPSKQDAEAVAAARTTPAARATWVEAATVEPSSASLHLVLPGEVDGSRDAWLASSQGGYVEGVDVEVGDDVEKGKLLFRIDRALYKARLAQIQAEIKAARREVERAKKAGRAIAAAEVDRAQDRLISAQTQARVAELQLSRASIRAPFAGTLGAVELDKGEVASPGTPAARLLVLDPIKVSVSVADRDVGLLKTGAEVKVSVDALAEPRRGTIARILPAADIDTRTFIVEVEVANEDRKLLPGMIARVAIEQTLEEDALMIPQGFLVTKREANGVFVVEDGVARWRPLRLGALVRDQVVIDSGLELGDNVVIVGQRALADGDPVILSRQGACCTDGRPTFGTQSETGS